MQSFLEFADEVVCHLKSVYVGCDDETLEDLVYLLEQVLQQYYILVADPINEDLLSALRDLLAAVLANRESRTIRNKGRPQIIIEKEKLLFFIEQGFKINNISDIFGCCRRTIERRMQVYSISQYNGSQISDLELDNAVREITALFPRVGAKSVSGRLRSLFSTKELGNL